MAITLQWCNTTNAQIETGCSTSYNLQQMAADIEGDIIGELDANGLNTNPPNLPQSGVGMLVSAAQYWLMRNIRIQQKHDGTIPNHLAIPGPIGIDVSIDKSIDYYDQKGRFYLDKYINQQTGADEEDDDETPTGGLLGLAGEEL